MRMPPYRRRHEHRGIKIQFTDPCFACPLFAIFINRFKDVKAWGNLACMNPEASFPN